ncbi:Crp/Fnr family transcriptional regulator [Prolixibacteraceae bacterium Z1-6]|uniref:Crp/Fnr family transcriptional regulator n=1 Tax=Draconibacterium aestuarii TaxID=2998507 RepID=A0A9X3F6Q2_9BACT|nr:Crp/Fnr family transcriptional regulator [Prolixibacteraceae bacterium Z1-6]
MKIIMYFCNFIGFNNLTIFNQYLWIMTDAFLNLLISLAPFTENELADALPYYQRIPVKKNDYFSKAGRISDRIGFVSSGLLRSFYTIKGKEVTTFFLTPGTIAASLVSFLEVKPAIENIQALEESEVIVISRKHLFQLYEGNWKWQQVGRILIENYYVKMEYRSLSLQNQSAQERYKQFVIEYPEVLKVAPQHQIASFLGIAPETLSRIRKAK